MGQVHRAAAAPDHLERVLEQRHHAEPQEIHLDDAERGAVVLVPLHHAAAGHGGGLERHHAVEAPLGDHHAARVLAQVPRQILDAAPEPGEVLHARLGGIAAGLAQVREQAVARIRVLPVAHELGEPLDRVGGQPQGLADLARRAAPAIGDHVGGHGRAEAPVALVDVLDHRFAPVAARQVEIDVGPLAALLGEEALEEQLHAHRVHRGEAERVAHRAVGRGAAPLHQHVVGAAVLDEVPDDEEVAGQVEAADQGQLVLDLPPRLLGERPRAVPVAGSRVGELAQEAERRLAPGQRVVGEAVAQVLQGEAEPQRQLAGIGHRLGAVREEPLHHPAALHEVLAVAREQPARGLERGVLADAREHVEQRAVPARDQLGLVGGERGQAQPRGLAAQPLVARLLRAAQVALQLREDVGAAVDADEPLEALAPGIRARARQRGRHRTAAPAGQADEAARELGQLLERGGAFPLRRAHLHAGQQAAEVLIPLAIFHQQRQPAAVGQRDLRAHQRREAEPVAGAIEPGRAVDAVGVQQRDGGLLEPRRALGQRFGQRRRLEKAEGTPGMQLDEHMGSPSPRRERAGVRG